MSVHRERAKTHRALASEQRQALLGVLGRAAAPLDASEAARAVGLHRNTARVHLDILVTSGFAVRVADQRTIPGRPRVLYGPAPSTASNGGHETTEGSYRSLAMLLANQIGESDDARARAMRAGERWADELDVQAITSGEHSGRQAIEAVTGILGELGFDPEPAPGCIRLRRCPFEEAARANRKVVCAVHRGMLTSVFDRLHSPVGVRSLDPFTSDDPLLCVVRLTGTRDERTAPRAAWK